MKLEDIIDDVNELINDIQQISVITMDENKIDKYGILVALEKIKTKLQYAESDIRLIKESIDEKFKLIGIW